MTDFEAVLLEIRTSYTEEEIAAFTSFDDFFAQEDIRNGYEPDWEEQKDYWKAILFKAYNSLKGKI